MTFLTIGRTCTLERQALRWVQKYVSAFNGDPTKVTMYVSSFLGQVDTFHSRLPYVDGANLLAQSLPHCIW